MNTWTPQQKKLVLYCIGFVLSVVVSLAMFYSLRTERAEVAKLNERVFHDEGVIGNSTLPSLQEQREWTAQQSELRSILLADDSVQQFYEEITRAAADNGIQGLGMTTEEVTIDSARAGEDESKVIAVGVRQYLSIAMKFRGQYTDIGRFMGAVSRLQRPVEYYSANMRRSQPYIDVQIIFHVYKRAPA